MEFLSPALLETCRPYAAARFHYTALTAFLETDLTMTPRNLNDSQLTFEQDGLLHFEEESHTYRVDGIGQLTPVSHVVSTFFKPFDADYWSLKKCHNDEDAAARLRDEWEARGAYASQAGTFMHKQIENYLNGIRQPELVCRTHYDGPFVHMAEEVDISREWNFFKAFDQETAYHPFRTEWGVYDAEAGIAGTIDLICSRDDGSYEIYDWKRSNKINPNEEIRWCHGLHGLEHLPDTSYTHYCIQQNLYRYLVEKNYGLKISRMNLVVLHPDYHNYRIVSIPVMDREIRTILTYLAQHPL